MTGRVGQTGRWRVTVPAVLAATGLLAGLGLSACGTDVAQAATVLRDPRATTVQLSNGSAVPATDGATVPNGATVITAPGGSASLRTAGRTVLLGQSTTVTVLDGAREQLRKGLVMVDARRAAALSLDAGAATVTAPRGSLSRVERGPLLRVGSFQQTVTVRADGRRTQADVRALHQVQVPYGGLPGQVTPLALTRDSWERRYALDLVTADIDLAGLAAGLDTNPTSGAAALRVVAASYPGVVPLAPGEPGSEEGLAFFIAKASRAGNAAGYARVRTLREEGGSWGVVAALVGADVAGVSAALDALLAPPAAGAILAAPGVGRFDIGTLLAGGPRPGLAGGAGGSRSGTQPAPTAGPPQAPVPSTPSPSPSPSPGPVSQLVDTVVGLLPTPPPTSATPTPAPSPLISVGIGGLGLQVG